jgi:hypothetical protein
LIHGKGLTLEAVALSNRFNEFCWIVRQQRVAPGSTKNHPQEFNLVIHRTRREEFCLAIPKIGNVGARNLAEIPVGTISKKSDEFVSSFAIEGRGAWCDFWLLANEPRVKELANGRVAHIFTGDLTLSLRENPAKLHRGPFLPVNVFPNVSDLLCLFSVGCFGGTLQPPPVLAGYTGDPKLGCWSLSNAGHR